ncbi:MAG: hypothetical protein BYD32DRAFT_67884 [Podila humilis]|nr:MAG: hypothetical protein BYD32DRAFT_67884 [Podila humilis]
MEARLNIRFAGDGKKMKGKGRKGGEEKREREREREREDKQRERETKQANRLSPIHPPDLLWCPFPCLLCACLYGWGHSLTNKPNPAHKVALSPYILQTASAIRPGRQGGGRTKNQSERGVYPLPPTHTHSLSNATHTLPLSLPFFLLSLFLFSPLSSPTHIHTHSPSLSLFKSHVFLLSLFSFLKLNFITPSLSFIIFITHSIILILILILLISSHPLSSPISLFLCLFLFILFIVRLSVMLDILL